MNGKERVEAVMGGKQPERVPVMCQLSLGHVVKNSGMSPAEFLINYNKAYSDTLVRLTLEYGLDGVLLDYPGHPYSEGINTEKAKSQVEKITKEGDGELITWKNGDSVFCPPVCFNGGVDVQGTLVTGTPADVRKEVYHLVDVLGRYQGGYIGSTSHSIMPETPLDNIQAMYEAFMEIQGK